MSASVFFEGSAELATLTNTFSVNGTPTDPATISLEITDPTGAATTYTYAAAQISRTSAGVYTKDIPCPVAGTWSYEWIGTVAASDVNAGTWEVLETQLGHLYCTVDMLKSRFKDTRGTDDFEYHSACFAASRSLEQYCERTFYRSPQVRTLNPCGGLYFLELPEFYDLVSINALKTDSGGDGTFETTWTASDYQLLCDDDTPNVYAGPEAKPYVKIRAVGSQTFPVIIGIPTRNDRIQIDGVWGWPSVPWAIKQAAAIVAAETFKLKDSAGTVASGYEDFDVTMLGSEARRRFARFANPYRRNAFMVA
jgi:hypothetical protein